MSLKNIGNPTNAPVMKYGLFQKLRGNTKIKITDAHHWLKPNILLKSEIDEKIHCETRYFFMGDKKEWMGFKTTDEIRNDFMIGLELQNPSKKKWRKK